MVAATTPPSRSTPFLSFSVPQRGVHFAETSTRARATIADLGARFVRPGATVLTHGASRVVLALLRRAAARGAQFSVLVTEGRPDGTGLIMARALAELGVPVVAILDCGAAAALETRRVDFALVGAEAVVESGGAVNKLGTYGIAVACAAAGVPLYVAAESYKFARIYPLSQRSLPAERKHVDFGPLMPRGVEVDNPSRDYTPPSESERGRRGGGRKRREMARAARARAHPLPVLPSPPSEYISLLFTDLGVLTPAAVSDELIQLYS
jgi:translation initiation factor eIF-2B subunit alpha